MNDSIVPGALQALVSNDPERISAVFAEDAEWLSPPGNAVARALGAPHHMVGSAAIARFFTADLPRLFARDLGFSLLGVHTDGERATVEATVTATLPDGSPFSNAYCFVFELRDGLVHRVREYTDTARAHRLLAGEASP
ncbi:nuclear transport factor 2 family protein [Streptomyces sp. NPDC048172]|uniref:nuclear transport factor 2 family protein n=1 Tax=Streptomyces sp. NPDC048172 TaxID=3365505 RepID=UPI0037131E05